MSYTFRFKSSQRMKLEFWNYNPRASMPDNECRLRTHIDALASVKVEGSFNQNFSVHGGRCLCPGTDLSQYHYYIRDSAAVRSNVARSLSEEYSVWSTSRDTVRDLQSYLALIFTAKEVCLSTGARTPCIKSQDTGSPTTLIIIVEATYL